MRFLIVLLLLLLIGVGSAGADVLGFNEVGNNTEGQVHDFVHGYGNFSLPEKSTITSVSLYANSTGGTDIVGAIYGNNNNLQGTTQEVYVSSEGWYQFNISNGVVLNSGEYIFALRSESNLFYYWYNVNSSFMRFYRDVSESYPEFPDSIAWDGTQDSRKASVYATYVPNDTPPIVANPSPSNNSREFISTINLSVDVADKENDVMNVTFILDGTVVHTESDISGASASSYVVSGLSNGTHTWNVTVEGGSLTRDSSNWKFFVNTTPPSFAIENTQVMDYDYDDDGDIDSNDYNYCMAWLNASKYEKALDNDYNGSLEQSDCDKVNNRVGRSIKQIESNMDKGDYVLISSKSESFPIRALNSSAVSDFYDWWTDINYHDWEQDTYICTDFSYDLAKTALKALGQGYIMHAHDTDSSHAYNIFYTGGNWTDLSNWMVLKSQSGNIENAATANGIYDTDGIGFLYDSRYADSPMFVHQLKVNYSAGEIVADGWYTEDYLQESVGNKEEPQSSRSPSFYRRFLSSDNASPVINNLDYKNTYKSWEPIEIHVNSSDPDGDSIFYDINNKQYWCTNGFLDTQKCDSFFLVNRTTNNLTNDHYLRNGEYNLEIMASSYGGFDLATASFTVEGYDEFGYMVAGENLWFKPSMELHAYGNFSLSEGGSVKELQAWVGGETNMIGAIYDTNGNLMATTEEIYPGPLDWHKLNIPSNVTLSSGEYIYGFISETEALTVKWNKGNTSYCRYSNSSWGSYSFPDEVNWDSTDCGYKHSIYAVYESLSPKVSNPSPLDGSLVSTSSITLEVDVSDPQDSSMNVSFYNASDDSLIGSDNNVASGDTASVTWSNLANGTHSWYVVADDGTNTTQSPTWSFTVFISEIGLFGYPRTGDNIDFIDDTIRGSNFTTPHSPDGNISVTNLTAKLYFDTDDGSYTVCAKCAIYNKTTNSSVEETEEICYDTGLHQDWFTFDFPSTVTLTSNQEYYLVMNGIVNDTGYVAYYWDGSQDKGIEDPDTYPDAGGYSFPSSISPTTTNELNSIYASFIMEGLDCAGDICINTTGWWYYNDDFNYSLTPISDAVSSADDGDEILIYEGGTYTETSFSIGNGTTLKSNINMNDVVIDLQGGNGITINSDATIRNMTVTNTTSSGIIIQEGSDGTLAKYINTSGINIESDNITVDRCKINNLTISSSSNYNDFTNNIFGSTTISMKKYGVSDGFTVNRTKNYPSNPTGYIDIGKYINVENLGTGEYAFINISYEDSDIPTASKGEDKLNIWRYTENWSETGWNGTRYYNPSNNIIGVNITSSSTFAPLVKSRGLITYFDKYAILKDNTSVDLTTQWQDTTVTALLGSNQNSNYSAIIDVALGNGNVSFNGVTIDTDRASAKSVIHGTSTIGEVSNRELLIPRIHNTSNVYVCPNASSLSDVNKSCPNIKYLNTSMSNVSTLVLEGENYYNVTGITGTGGGEIQNCSYDVCVNTTGWWITSFNSSAQPLSDGYDNASAGDTVFINQGTYTENLTLNKDIHFLGNGTYNQITIEGEMNYSANVLWENLTLAYIYSPTYNSGAVERFQHSEGGGILTRWLGYNPFIEGGAGVN